jgi:hypothetical protein|tara:strand:- start:579 stop:884 length:306 start_codon:yes stop_codon:yes gene_type:complete
VQPTVHRNEAVKITLHKSIPEARRPEIEALVNKHAGPSTIIWMPSRFPRLVILVEPQSSYQSQPDGGSFFESSHSEDETLAAMSESLEEKIKDCLAKAPSL